MKIIFRVDASTQIGIGHVMRCRNLANALIKNGDQVQFILRDHDGHVAYLLARDGFVVTLLPKIMAPPKDTVGYIGWLGVSQEQDAEDTIHVIKKWKPDLLVVDHYAIDFLWESLVKPHVKKLMVIDDLANRNHDCDFLIDQNYDEEGKKDYLSLVPTACKLLLGPRYALLNPEYAKYRRTLAPRSDQVRRVFIFMGGSDISDITGLVVDIFNAPEFSHIYLDIVIGVNYAYKSKLINLVQRRGSARLYGPREHLADLMAQADLAVGAGGVATWERLCIGLPSLVFSAEKNQDHTCQVLSSLKLIEYAGDVCSPDPTVIRAKIAHMIENIDKINSLTSRGREMVDGLGINRVAEALNSTPYKRWVMRPANHNDVTSYFGVAKAAEYPAENDNRYILEVGDLPIGELIFEGSYGETLIKYCYDEICDDKSIETQLIKHAFRMLNNLEPINYGSVVNFSLTASVSRFAKFDVELCADKQKFRIAIISDVNTWLNDWIPNLVLYWLNQGHSVLWVHDVTHLESADFCFYIGFYQIVPKYIRQNFKNNLVVHESDLPMGKGWSPMTWQILEGCNNVSVVLIEAEDKVDSGVIYLKSSLHFEGYELIDSIRCSQATATLDICIKFIDSYPSVVEGAQAQVGSETYYKKRSPVDSQLDISSSLSEQFNLLRVVDNERYPAFFEMSGFTYVVKVERQKIGEG